MGTAVWAAIDGLATAVAAQNAWSSTPFITGLPTPAQQAQHSVHGYVSGEIEDWTSDYSATVWDDGTGLRGTIDEAFVLKAGVYVKQLAGTLTSLRDVAQPLLEGIRAAVRTDHTLGGALSGAGLAKVIGLQTGESLFGDQLTYRELHVLVRISCAAVVDAA